MTDEPDEIPKTDSPPLQPRVTKRDLVEGNAERAVTDHTARVGIAAGGGVDYSNLKDIVDAAKLLSAAGEMIPPFFRGNVGAMFANCLRAQELGVSPLTLANWTYAVENKGVTRIAYESQMFHALIEARAPIVGRMKVWYEGEGDDLKCFVSALFKGETEPRQWPPADRAHEYTLKKLKPGLNQYGQTKGSPLWDKKPEVQMFYNVIRDFARVFFPDVLGGMYGKDEMEDVGFTDVSQTARDVSPKLLDRLRAATSDEGFVGEQTIQSIDTALAAAKAPEPIKKTKTTKGTETLEVRQEGET
jgi:RecT family protein